MALYLIAGILLWNTILEKMIFSAFLVKGEDTFSNSDRGGARNFTTGD